MSTPPEPIEKALAQTSETQAKLAAGVQELAVTNAVLQQEIPEEARSDDVALAIEKNEALEVRVQECVDDLDDVTQALTQALTEEVARRKQLEQTLKQAGVPPPSGSGA